MIIKSFEQCQPAIAVVCCIDGTYILDYMWHSPDGDRIAWKLRKQAYQLIRDAIDRDYPGLGDDANTFGCGLSIQLNVNQIRPEHKTEVPCSEISFKLLPDL
jgi:hypothetical protein